jgi:predicted outer membrane repeat protein
VFVLTDSTAMLPICSTVYLAMCRTHTQYAGAMLAVGPLQAVNLRFIDNDGGEFGGAVATANTVSFKQVRKCCCTFY